MMPQDPWTWALVLRTYNRADMLLRCISLAMAQTEPPAEVIVIDASADWETTRDRILRDCAPNAPRTRWVIESARVKSMTHQHDQGIRLATADVVFLIDDDSLMYPDAAAEVMRIYRAASKGAIAAVGLRKVGSPPDEPQPVASSTPTLPQGRTGLIGGLRRRFDRASINFIPYDGWRALPALEPELAELATAVQVLKGFQMTALREAALQSPPSRCIFSGIHEDLDFSYRLGKLGLVVTSRHARLFHAMAVSGRKSRRSGGLFKVLNMALLTRQHAPESANLRGYFLQRMILEFGSDLLGRRWTFPQFRGTCRGVALARQLRSMPRDQLESWASGVTRRELGVLSSAGSLRKKEFA